MTMKCNDFDGDDGSDDIDDDDDSVNGCDIVMAWMVTNGNDVDGVLLPIQCET